MNRTDFDSEEQDFQREIEVVLRANRAREGTCPRPELLMAACSGVPFEGAVDVQRHLAICPICEQLSRDLSEYEFPAATNAEDRRIRSRWQAAQSGPAVSWLGGWKPWFVAATVAMLVVGTLVVRGTHH